jgi:hypothetical protein
VEDFGQARMLTVKRGKRTVCCIKNFLEKNFSHEIASQFVAPSSVRSRSCLSNSTMLLRLSDVGAFVQKCDQ